MKYGGSESARRVTSGSQTWPAMSRAATSCSGPHAQDARDAWPIRRAEDHEPSWSTGDCPVRSADDMQGV